MHVAAHRNPELLYPSPPMLSITSATGRRHALPLHLQPHSPPTAVILFELLSHMHAHIHTHAHTLPQALLPSHPGMDL